MSDIKGLTVRADADIPEILIYDEIGPSWAGMVDAKSVMTALASVSNAAEVNVRIKSPGGSAFEGVAIYNALRRWPAKIIIDIDAIAASAASYIAMAGDRIRIASNAWMMIHRTWVIAAGDQDELLNYASLLQKMDEQQVETYAARSGLSKEEVKAMVDAETWMTASEAVAKGFADEISQELNVKASIPDKLVSVFKNTPKQFLRHEADRPVIPFPGVAAAARKNDDFRKRLRI